MDAIHGFLGTPADWSPPLCPVAVSSFPNHSLTAWGEALAKSRAASYPEGQRTLIGYSLGGRLALHAWLAAPDLWDKLVLISTHPGLRESAEREMRQKHDAAWADRFRSLPWKEVLAQWNAQPVFTGHAIAPEEPKEREAIARQLTQLSLGLQADLRPLLKACKVPVYWIAGERDQKFATLAYEMASLSPKGRAVIVAGVGHRVPWEAPQWWARFMEKELV